MPLFVFCLQALFLAAPPADPANNTNLGVGVGIGIGVGLFIRETTIHRFLKPPPIPIPTPRFLRFVPGFPYTGSRGGKPWAWPALTEIDLMFSRQATNISIIDSHREIPMNRKPSATKEKLLEEIAALEQRIHEFEQYEALRRKAEESLQESEQRFRQNLRGKPGHHRTQACRRRTRTAHSRTHRSPWPSQNIKRPAPDLRLLQKDSQQQRRLGTDGILYTRPFGSRLLTRHLPRMRSPTLPGIYRRLAGIRAL